MKLYFYKLLSSGAIMKESAEVNEKPKTYKPVGKFPSFFYGCFVRKEDIGHMTGFMGNVIVLTEEDDERARNIFLAVYESRLKKSKKDAENLESMVCEIKRCEIRKGE